MRLKPARCYYHGMFWCFISSDKWEELILTTHHAPPVWFYVRSLCLIQFVCGVGGFIWFLDEDDVSDLAGLFGFQDVVEITTSLPRSLQSFCHSLPRCWVKGPTKTATDPEVEKAKKPTKFPTVVFYSFGIAKGWNNVRCHRMIWMNPGWPKHAEVGVMHVVKWPISLRDVLMVQRNQRRSRIEILCFFLNGRCWRCGIDVWKIGCLLKMKRWHFEKER